MAASNSTASSPQDRASDKGSPAARMASPRGRDAGSRAAALDAAAGEKTTGRTEQAGSKDGDETKPKWSRLSKRGREQDADDYDQHEWWFASTAIPLFAATLGPLANVLSIAALVTYWRMDLIGPDGTKVPELQGYPFPDPTWCYWLNVASLICGFVGNLFLLMNFTQRVRYIVALPMTIFLWYMATGLLIGITACIALYEAPGPNQAYTQGFWYAVIAACLYLICSMILMVNMLGYFLGHYPQHFNLTDHQRTLILQTMLFFIWLAGGGGIFSKVEEDYEGWSFADALYFCDVTILTVGFGDLTPSTDVGRGLVFPYSVGGIIMLGLVISSIHNFAGELGEDKVVQRHVERVRARTVGRSVATSTELRRRAGEIEEESGLRPVVSEPPGVAAVAAEDEARRNKASLSVAAPVGNAVQRVVDAATARQRQPRLLLLRSERARFEAMREIQRSTARFKRWWGLSLSVCAFGILWCVGAVVFWQTERGVQGMTYFQALYLCYVSLLTIGYGDLAPQSNAGRPFFVIWSLVAVPTMTILISDMGDTVISGFERGTFLVADFTVLPKVGVWRRLVRRMPWLFPTKWARAAGAAAAATARRRSSIGGSRPRSVSVTSGARKRDPSSTAAAGDDIAVAARDIEATAAAAQGFPNDAAMGRPRPRNAFTYAFEDSDPSSSDLGPADASGPAAGPNAALGRCLAAAIRRAATDVREQTAAGGPPTQYSFDEWVAVTRLMREVAQGPGANAGLRSPAAGGEGVGEGDAEGEGGDDVVAWDWIGQDSPLMRRGESEAEFVLGRLCECLVRFMGRMDGGGG
ncbi:hypothetical protein BDY21DRAFT_348367 [Lineolata rhizophorae]|uniref:Potassium channel domain-containing protein n=1 Tax=Lineolata rhizophorae TaxID=578093 RepID=A0A6A6NWV7_9PEZI|nr:hypothetical protein BDY21DRAFT_348367 [Lineolata rhizophorae]